MVYVCYNMNMSKKVFISFNKSEAKAKSLSSVLSSFRIEGVELTTKQIESVKSRLHLGK